MSDISIIIPARNEERYLPTSLEAISKASKKVPNLTVETVVVINRCDDRTEEIAKSFGAKIVHNHSKNLSQIRNCGVFAANGEVIITIDADSLMSENLLLDIYNSMQSGKYVGGGVLILPERWSLGILTTGIFVGATLLLLRVSVGVFFCRKADFLAFNGFNENLSSAEDIHFARALKKYGKNKGLKFKHIFSSHIVTSCRKFDRFGDWYLIQNPLRALRLFFGKDPEYANKWWYDTER